MGWYSGVVGESRTQSHWNAPTLFLSFRILQGGNPRTSKNKVPSEPMLLHGERSERHTPFKRTFLQSSSWISSSRLSQSEPPGPIVRHMTPATPGWAVCVENTGGFPSPISPSTRPGKHKLAMAFKLIASSYTNSFLILSLRVLVMASNLIISSGSQ